MVAVEASATYAILTFRAVYRVIRRGDGDFPSLRLLASRAAGALRQWALEDSIWKARRTTSLFHIVVAWGFVFYFLVNFGDVVQGFFITFLGEGLIGDVYRLLADLVTVAVLAGVAYLLLRRFVWRSPALSLRADVPLMAQARAGIPRDSLIVGLFILAHVGFRLVGDSLAIAQHGADPFQPFGTALSRLWAGWGDGALVVGRHAAWWLAVGLILAFIPYFPYTKHFHLIMSGVNFLTKPKRTSPGALDPLNFADESREEFGAARIEQLPWPRLMDAYACIMCNRCQDVCPATVTGRAVALGAGDQQAILPERAPGRTGCGRGVAA